MELLDNYKEGRTSLYRNEQKWFDQESFLNTDTRVLNAANYLPADSDNNNYSKFYENLKILDNTGAESWITALRSNITNEQQSRKEIYEVNLSGAGCRLYDYRGWMPNRASISQNYTVKEMYSNGTFNPMDDRNIYNCLPTEMEAMKEYVFDSIFRQSSERWEILNLTPVIYGTITLIKGQNAPDAGFEYSVDGGGSWTSWDIDGITNSYNLIISSRSGILPGTTIYIRSKNGYQTLSTGSSLSNSHYFDVPPYTIIGGCLESLLTNVTGDGGYDSARNVGTANIFKNCSITGTIRIRSARIPYPYALTNAFSGCKHLRRVILEAQNIRAVALANWLDNTPGNAGVLYCPHDLQLDPGADGLPDGWVRIDI